MKNLIGFSKKEIKLIKDNLKYLMQSSENKSNIITGFNYYNELISSEGVIIRLNYQHRNQKHLDSILKDVKEDNDLSILLDPVRTDKIKLFREKRAIYLFKKNWPLPKDSETGKLFESVELFNYDNDELLDRSKLNEIETLSDFPEYKNAKYPIALRELDGRELNLNILTKTEASKILNLFRTKGFRMKMTEEGLTYLENGYPIRAINTWPDPDRTPCIILGRQIPEFFPEGLPDFKKIHKIAVIKLGNEISFCINNKYQHLLQHSAYKKLKTQFDKNLKDIEVYANNAFVKEYIDE
ncbi:hypothetical protein JW851_03770 [Candidatus Woesearchaeota archaeon]|nr:hypothetical protein [Candidatus Woesearchaeota archaeon]